MTPEEQRIAIAEARGWKRKPEFDYARLMRGAVDAVVWVEMWGTDHGHLIPFEMMPSYLTDLNAMHEAEKCLPAIKHPGTYGMILEEVSGGWSMTATAAQRAEAFLRTIGKWEESP